MRIRQDAIEIDLEVPFHDVDPLGVVWFGHYYRYLDLARAALMRSRGVDVSTVAALGYRLFVVESKCRHSFPLRYGDRFRVTAWLRDIEHRIYVAYEVTNLTHGRRSARGHTVLVTTDEDGTMLTDTPAPLERLLRGTGQ